MDTTPLDTFLLRRISDADLRRPAPGGRPSADPVTGPSASAPGNPAAPAPKQR